MTKSRRAASPDRDTPRLAEVREHVEELVASPDFPGSERHAKLLRYLVAGSREQPSLDAYSIARDVLGRPDDFDPQSDPIVRVEVGRLRRALDAYYLKRPNATLRVEIPKGAYKASAVRQAPRAPETPAAVDALPALAILPLTGTGTSEYDYLARGLTEELLLALTRFQDLRVYVYRGRRPEDSSDAGGAVEARFVLTGTVSVSDATIRLTVRLTDGEHGHQLWGERFEKELTAGSLFSIQDEVASGVAIALADSYGVIPRTLNNESRGRRTESLDAYEGVLKFHEGLWRWDESSFEQAREALERAVEADGSYAWPIGALAGLHVNDYQYYLVEDPEKSLAAAERLARRAVALDPQCHRSRWSMVYVYYCKHDRLAFEREIDVAIKLNPHHASMIGEAGVLLVLAESWDRGLDLVRQSMAMNPFYPLWYHGALSVEAYARGRYEEALLEAERMDLPDFWWNPVMRSACLVRLDRVDEATELLDGLRTSTNDLERKAPHIVRAVIFSEAIGASILADLASAGLTLDSR